MAHRSFEIPDLLKCWFARLATSHAWKCSFRTNLHHNQKQVIWQKCIWFNFQGLVPSRDSLFQHLKQLSVAVHGLIQVSLLSESQNGPRELFCSLFAFLEFGNLGLREFAFLSGETRRKRLRKLFLLLSSHVLLGFLEKLISVTKLSGCLV